MGPRRTVGRRLLLAAGLTGLLVLAGCSNALRWEPDYHTVRQGETLYSIAFRYGLDQRQLAAWNGLGSGRLIYPGQRLKLTGPAVSASGQTPRSAKKAPAPRAPTIPVSPSTSAGFSFCRRFFFFNLCNLCFFLVTDQETNYLA